MSTVIKSDSRGVERISGEANDCTVRALANVSGMPYSIADRVLSAEGRRSRRRCGLEAMHAAYKRMGLELQAVYGEDRTARYMQQRIAPGSILQQGSTIGTQIKTMTQGRYIVLIRGHVFAVVDGKVLDYGNIAAGSRIQAVYKLAKQAVIFDK